MLVKNKRKGQGTLEYALVIALVIGALLAIQQYMGRGMQGRLKESTDQIGKQFDPANFTTARRAASDAQNSRVRETRDTASGDITSNIQQGETITRTEDDDWGSAPVAQRL